MRDYSQSPGLLAPFDQTDPGGVCARCAAQGRGCCVITPAQDELAFPVFEEERARISDHVGHDRGFFRSPNTQGFWTMLETLFPGEEAVLRERFPEWSAHFRLATDEDGTCAFLGRGGCTLPAEVRPAHCRLFPAWVLHGSLVFTAGPCLAKEEARGVAMLLRSVNITPALARELYQRLRRYLGLGPVPGAGKGFHATSAS